MIAKAKIVYCDLTDEEWRFLRGNLIIRGKTIRGWFTEMARTYIKTIPGGAK